VQIEKLMVAAKKYNILIDASENCITFPIGGEIYIFDCQPLTNDWKEHILSDGHYWQLDYQMFPMSHPFEKRKLLISDEKNSESNKFCKYAYYNTESKVLLVHYLGDEAEAGKSVPDKSKNILTKASKYVRDNALAPKDPKSAIETYAELLSKADAEAIAITAPKDRRTVPYYKHKTILENKSHANEMAATFITAGMLGTFVVDIQLQPHLVVTCITDRGAAELQEVLKLLRPGMSLILHYDTKIPYGDYFISVLSYRHPLIEPAGEKASSVSKEAIVPLAFVIHHKKAQNVHAGAFEKIGQRLDGENPESKLSFSSTPKVMVSDRELNGADLLPNTRPLWCHIHLRKNVHEQAKKLGYTQDESLQIVKNLETLLKSTRLETYTKKKDELLQSALWTSHNFSRYFTSHMDADILTRAAKWLIEGYGIEHPEKVITNNSSETINSVLHPEGGKATGKQLGVDMALIKFKHHIDRNDNEINRAYYGIGNFQLKEPLLRRKMKTIPTYQLLTPDEMIQQYKELTAPGYDRNFEESPVKLQWEEAQEDSIESMAEFYVQHNYIRPVPFTQYYMGLNLSL
jgi:hypothetical protein